MKKIIVLLTLLITTSCIPKDKYMDAKVVVVDVPHSDKLPKIVADSIFDSVKYVKLDNQKDALVGELSGIILHDNLIYISDRRRNAILLFDMSGRFVDKIECRGRGKGEYLYLDDYKIKESCIVILDRANKQLLYYDLETLKFVRQLELDNYYSRFDFLDENIILYGDYGFEQNIVVINGESGEIIEDSLKPVIEEQIGVGFSHNPFFKYKEKIYATFPFEYSLYEIDALQCKRVLDFDFGSDMYAPQLQKASSDEREEYKKGLNWMNYPIENIERAVVSDDYIIVSFVYRLMNYSIVYNRSSDTYKCGLISSTKKFPFATQLYSGSFDNKLIYAIDAVNIVNYPKVKPEELIEVESEDNLIIAIYDLKSPATF